MKCIAQILALLLLIQGAFAADKSSKQTKPTCPDKAPPPVCFEPGYPNEKNCFGPAYNQPARVKVGGTSWTFWADASFTYWEALEEGLGLAVNTEINDGSLVYIPNNGKFIFQDSSYKPGFKIGLGMDLGYDDWSLFGEYTWFRSTTVTHATSSGPGVPVLFFSSWFAMDYGYISAKSLASKWNLNIDLADVAVSRPFYQGTHLILEPFGGIRGQWIRQDLTLRGSQFFVYSGGDYIQTRETAQSTTRAHSWAVGPRAGCLGKWHLGWGFRFEGDAAASVLYTQYTKVSTNQDNLSVGTEYEDIYGTAAKKAEFRDYNCLRVVNEMNLGVGWGRYFDRRNYHLDFLLSYDFQVFWNQNIMRDLKDTIYIQTGASSGNLYLQGLTLKTQFDF